ncbi:MAG: right-handed parallel beta-helix repeat-containing protein, partial [Firmicutes bacterium]|nr:right-handed parallel beta-helix repeat-containing protein [Bacillota bacterium]
MKRFLSLVLVLMLCLSTFGVCAFANTDLGTVIEPEALAFEAQVAEAGLPVAESAEVELAAVEGAETDGSAELEAFAIEGTEVAVAELAGLADLAGLAAKSSEGYVAEVAGVKYADVKTAWAAVWENGSITMLADWNLDSALVVPENRRMTINMNGHMINRGLSGTAAKNGEAIRVEEGATLTIKGGDTSVVHKGYVSNGVWFSGDNADSAVDITGALITGAHNNDYGGAINALDGSIIRLSDVTIAGNKTAYDGAGVYMEDGNDLYLERTKIMYNWAKSDGGGIFMDEDYCRVMGDNNSIITHNTANSWGGGIYADGVSNGKICRVTITNNYAAVKGGGILVDNDSDVLLEDITVMHNIAGTSGAGVFCEAYIVEAGHIDLNGKIVIKDNYVGNDQDNIILEKASLATATYKELSLAEGSEVGFGNNIKTLRMIVSWENNNNSSSNGSKSFMDFDEGWAAAIEKATGTSSDGTQTNNVTVKLLSDWNAENGNFDFNADDGFLFNGAICVPEGLTVTLDMNGHTINRRLNSYGYNGEVISVFGTLYLSNGTVSGGYSCNGGGGIHI